MKLIFHHKDKEAENIYSFYFNRPTVFKFLPGQYIYLTIPDLTNDYRGPTRHFTISSNPNSKYIRITTFIRDISHFKKELANLRKGDEIEAEGPTGTFILDDHEKGDHVLIAGGIGITPFISIIDYHVKKKLKSHLTLLYSVKSANEGAFTERLQQLGKENDSLSIDITYTQEPPKGWRGLTGRIDKNMLNDLLDPKNKYWLCGPPGMVTNLEKLLKQLGTESNKIVSEKFTGY